MKTNQKIVAIASLLSLFTISNSYAAAYSSSLYSTSGLANSYAGSVTGTHDASDMFFNPAASANINNKQFIFSVSQLNLNIDSDKASAKNALGGNVYGPEGKDSGVDSQVPAIYFSAPINKKTTFGFSINSPFGLATSYDQNWVGRYQAIDSSIKTINFNPSASYKLNDELSLGVGLQAQYYQARLTKAVLKDAIGTSSDGIAKAKGSDWGYGYNLGAIYKINNQFKIGAGYRSKIDQKITGTAHLSIPGSEIATSNFNANTTTPESLTIGTNYKVNEKVDLSYDATWTRWSRVKSLSIIAYQNTNLSDNTKFNWHDSFLHSVGANFSTSDKWLFRTGLAYEKDGVTAAVREARVPNSDKVWTSAGFNYKISNGYSVDGTYLHQFYRTAKINRTTSTEGTLNVKNTTRVDVFSIALKKDF